MYSLWIANKNYSSWSLRPWVLLRVLNIPFKEYQALFNSGGSSYEKFTVFSPTGQVPCLIDDQQIIWDSLAICEYIAEDHPHAWPQDRQARAWARSAAAEMHSGFLALRQNCPMECTTRLAMLEISNELKQNIMRLETLWQEGLDKFGGPWLAGEQFTAVDAFFAPIAFRIQSYQLPVNDVVQQWVEQTLTLSAMQEWYQAASNEELIDH